MLLCTDQTEGVVRCAVGQATSSDQAEEQEGQELLLDASGPHRTEIFLDAPFARDAFPPAQTAYELDPYKCEEVTSWIL